MKENTCCFTGHRTISPYDYEKLKISLQKTIIELVNNDVTKFLCGGALGFDTIAAETVISLRSISPKIRLIMVYPCKNQFAYWTDKDIQIYNYIKNNCDEYLYISENYNKCCMFERNRYLVDCSSHCICYLNKNNGGTAYTVNYAQKRGLSIINLAEIK